MAEYKFLYYNRITADTLDEAYTEEIFNLTDDNIKAIDFILESRIQNDGFGDLVRIDISKAKKHISKNREWFNQWLYFDGEEDTPDEVFECINDSFDVLTIIENMEIGNVIPLCFYEYDSYGDKNPEGPVNGGAIIALIPQ